MALANYGATNPNAIDPFPIETTLAQMAYGGDRAQSQTALGLYQLKNMVSQDNYDYDLAQQHEFAKQQLAATMADNYAKNAHSFLTDPNGLAFLRANPQLTYLLGQDPGNTGISAIIGRQNAAQAAQTLQRTGEGALALGNAGYHIPTDQLSGTTGYSLEDQTPISVQAATARGANQRPEHFNLPVNVGKDAAQNLVTVPVAIPFGASEEEKRARIIQAIKDAIIAHPGMRLNPGIEDMIKGGGGTSSGSGGGGQSSGTGNPYVAPDGSVKGGEKNPLLGGLPNPAEQANPSQQPAAPRGRTNLPMAKPDTPSSGAQAAPLPAPAQPPAVQTEAPSATPSSNQVILDQRAQAIARVKSRTLPPAIRQDIADGSSGGVLQMFPTSVPGTVAIRGKSGKFYPVQVQ